MKYKGQLVIEKGFNTQQDFLDRNPMYHPPNPDEYHDYGDEGEVEAEELVHEEDQQEQQDKKQMEGGEYESDLI